MAIVPTMMSIVRESVIGAFDTTLVLDVLLLEFGSSGLDALTAAVAESDPAVVAATTILIVAWPPAASVPSGAVTTPLSCVPSVEETNVVPAGRFTVSMTSLASSGPLFFTVAVYVIWLPWATVAWSAVKRDPEIGTRRARRDRGNCAVVGGRRVARAGIGHARGNVELPERGGLRDDRHAGARARGHVTEWHGHHAVRLTPCGCRDESSCQPAG